MPWIPAALFVVLALGQMAVSLLAYDWARYGLVVHEASLRALAAVFWTVGGLTLALPGFRAWLVPRLDSLTTAPPRTRRLALGAAYVGVFLWLGFFHLCTYRRYLLVNDTAFSVNLAYNFIHSGSLAHTLFGAHALSIHFMFLMAVFSPVLLVWNHPLALIAVQHALVCSVPFAAYLLAERRSGSSAVGLGALLLTLCTPYFHDLVGSNLHISALAAFLPWGLWFRAEGRRAAFLACFGLMLVTYETAAFALAGFGAYLAVGERRPRAGAAVVAAAAALFFAELSVVRAFEAREPIALGAVQRFEMFDHLVPAGVPREKVLAEVLSQPWRVAAHLISSPYLYFPSFRVLFFAAFLPLLGPGQLVLWGAVLPQVISGRGEPIGLLVHVPKTYYDFGGHHGAFLLGPLAFATALGAAQALRRWPFRFEPRAGLTALCLVAAGTGLSFTNVWTNPNFMPHWFDAMPRVLARVPPRARVWADDNVTPHLAARRWLRLINYSSEVGYGLGYQRLFKPDYVVLDKAWVDFALPPNRETLLTYWARERFRKVHEESDVMLLRAPEPSADPDAVPALVSLPEPDMPLAREYADYLLSGPVEGE